MFENTLYEDAIRIINSWIPKQNYHNETQYRDDLIEFLRERFDRINDSMWGGTQRRTSIKKEDGRGLCDIAIGEAVGIEMKKDLCRKEQVDRLSGQLLDYKKQYSDLIIVLVGKTNGEALELLKEKIASIFQDNSFGMNRVPSVKIIIKNTKTGETKDKKSEKKHTKSNDDPLNFKLPEFKPIDFNLPKFKF